MKLSTLQFYLSGIQEDNYGHCVLNFCDQYGDYYTVNQIFKDSNGRVCLNSDCGYDMTVDDLMSALTFYYPVDNVYFENDDPDPGFFTADVKGGWYTDDEGDVVMDITNHNDGDNY